MVKVILFFQSFAGLIMYMCVFLYIHILFIATDVHTKHIYIYTHVYIYMYIYIYWIYIYLLVILVHISMSKAFSTKFAFVWFVLTMDNFMRSYLIETFERFTADLTGVRAFLCGEHAWSIKLSVCKRGKMKERLYPLRESCN